MPRGRKHRRKPRATFDDMTTWRKSNSTLRQLCWRCREVEALEGRTLCASCAGRLDRTAAQMRERGFVRSEGDKGWAA
jgi:hypothetical protein